LPSPYPSLPRPACQPHSQPLACHVRPWGRSVGRSSSLLPVLRAPVTHLVPRESLRAPVAEHVMGDGRGVGDLLHQSVRASISSPSISSSHAPAVEHATCGDRRPVLVPSWALASLSVHPGSPGPYHQHGAAIAAVNELRELRW
jgi:hypothetical protein